MKEPHDGNDPNNDRFSDPIPVNVIHDPDGTIAVGTEADSAWNELQHQALKVLWSGDRETYDRLMGSASDEDDGI